MAVIQGVIALKDNASAVIRQVRNEQTQFRRDVEKTRKELAETWDKKRQAKLDTTSASKRMTELKTKLEPLRKKVVTAIAVKDMAKAKIKDVTTKVKAVGKMIAKPVVKVTVMGMNALKSVTLGVANVGKAVGKGLLNIGKMVAVGGVAVAGAALAGLATVFSGSTEAARAQMEAETKLSQVMKNTMNASQKEVSSIIALTDAQERLGVVSADAQLSGAQELGTYLTKSESLKKLIPIMNDMAAQQYGVNASEENAVNIATMLGKVMNGQVGALSRYGYTFDKAQEKILKFGTEEQRAAVLAEVVGESVGGMNKALGETDAGKIKQMENAFSNMKEEVGKAIVPLKAQFAGIIVNNLPLLQKLGTTLTGVLSKGADTLFPIAEKIISRVIPMVENGLNNIGKVSDKIAPLINGVFSGISEAREFVAPIINDISNGFINMLPDIKQFGGTITSVIKRVAKAAIPAIGSIIGSVQTAIPVVLPILATLASVLGGVFESGAPSFAQFAGSIIQGAAQIAANAMPVVVGIINTIQEIVPKIMPVLETVMTGVGNLFTAALPIISKLTGAIGVAVTTLAPVFQTIFGQIAEKVGSVISFIGERMDFITGVIGWAAPVISDILTTAWNVLSPVMDLVCGVFKLLFSVVQRVFPSIQSILQTVWGVIKPIVEGVGNVVGKIAGGFNWIADKITGGGKKPGKNANGTNSWCGGLTWVGEKGAELLEVPRGARILPNKESLQFARAQSQPVIANAMPKRNTPETQDDDGKPQTVIINIDPPDDPDTPDFPKGSPPPPAGAGAQAPASARGGIIVKIAKLADKIIVREDADIEKLADRVANMVVEKIKLAALNT